jgi:hypothetical protein
MNVKRKMSLVKGGVMSLATLVLLVMPVAQAIMLNKGDVGTLSVVAFYLLTVSLGFASISVHKKSEGAEKGKSIVWLLSKCVIAAGLYGLVLREGISLSALYAGYAGVFLVVLTLLTDLALIVADTNEMEGDFYGP